LGRYLWQGAATAGAVSLLAAWALVKAGTALSGSAEKVF
jgi:hypothetical protein